MRNARSPMRCASWRYSSTTAFTSRGGTECRSNTSVTGIRTGSSSSIADSAGHGLGQLKYKPGQQAPAGFGLSVMCSAPDVKRLVESVNGSRSLPSDLSSEVSISSTASPPTVALQSDGEAIPDRPASSQNPSVGWQAGDTLRWLPSGAPSILLVRSVPWAIPPNEVAAPSRSVGNRARWVISVVDLARYDRGIGSPSIRHLNMNETS